MTIIILTFSSLHCFKKEVGVTYNYLWIKSKKITLSFKNIILKRCLCLENKWSFSTIYIYILDAYYYWNSNRHIRQNLFFTKNISIYVLLWLHLTTTTTPLCPRLSNTQTKPAKAWALTKRMMVSTLMKEWLAAWWRISGLQSPPPDWFLMVLGMLKICCQEIGPWRKKNRCKTRFYCHKI